MSTSNPYKARKAARGRALAAEPTNFRDVSVERIGQFMTLDLPHYTITGYVKSSSGGWYRTSVMLDGYGNVCGHGRTCRCANRAEEPECKHEYALYYAYIAQVKAMISPCRSTSLGMPIGAAQ